MGFQSSDWLLGATTWLIHSVTYRYWSENSFEQNKVNSCPIFPQRSKWNWYRRSNYSRIGEKSARKKYPFRCLFLLKLALWRWGWNKPRIQGPSNGLKSDPVRRHPNKALEDQWAERYLSTFQEKRTYPLRLVFNSRLWLALSKLQIHWLTRDTCRAVGISNLEKWEVGNFYVWKF